MTCLPGKIALVTGGAGGIGQATVRQLADAGVHVVVADIDVEAARSIAAEIGGRAVALDVTDPAAWNDLSAELCTRSDTVHGIDILVLNAGVMTNEGDISGLSDAAYRRTLGVNIDGVVLGTRAMIPHLAKRGGGSIVAVSSLAGLVPYAADPVYAMTKHAVIGFVRSVAPQLEPLSITANVVCPGMTDTAMVDPALRRKLERAGSPLIAPADIARAVLTAVEGDRTGRTIVCQPNRTEDFRFANIPRPGVAPDHAKGPNL